MCTRGIYMFIQFVKLCLYAVIVFLCNSHNITTQNYYLCCIITPLGPAPLLTAFHNSCASRPRAGIKTPISHRDRPVIKYTAHHMNLKIVLIPKDRITNPTRYGKPKRSPAEKDARSVALGRSLVIRMCPEWENQLNKMNLSKRGRPFAYPDLLMGGIAYIRYVLGEGLRVIEGHMDAMLGKTARISRQPTIPCIIIVTDEIIILKH